MDLWIRSQDGDKITIKLLQSEGMQRNEINQIIANNKEPYTYKRYLEVINRR